MDKVDEREQKLFSNESKIQKTDGLGFWILSALLMMYVLTGVLLFVMAFLLYKFQLEETFVTIGIIVAYVGSSFCGGVLMGKRLKASCGFLGLLLGTLYFLILFVGSVILNHGLPEDVIRMVAIWIMCGCSSMLGAMLFRKK